MKITIEIEFDVVERHDETIRGFDGSAETLARDLREYFTSHEAPLMADYGNNAWGGYDGAYIAASRITRCSVDREGA